MPSDPAMKISSTSLDRNWLDVVGAEFERPYMAHLNRFLQQEKNVYPKRDEVFNALNLTAFEDIKVVIIGQDPYHGEGQAHGLCFSVPKGVDIPRSLKNIYKEIEAEYRIEMPCHGDLSRWAAQGVLLLNATLTVREGKPGSHRGQGWEKFTDACIRAISEKRENIVFLFWGQCAQEKEALIDPEKHHVLKTSHPSPFSVHKGFFGCDHFKKANAYLRQHRLQPVKWQEI